MAEKDTLVELKDLFQVCRDAEQEQRTQMLDDLEFARMSDQWPADIAKMRREEGRPTLTINRLPAFIRQVVNDVRQNRPQIKVKPVDGAGDRKTAEVFAGLIRNIEVSSQSDIAYDTAFDFAVSCGIGYFRVDIEYMYGETFDKKLTIKRIPNVFSVYGDPMSKEGTSADWNKAFLVDAMSKTEFEHEYKGAEPVDWEGDYQPLGEPWYDEESVTICEAWTRDKIMREILKLSNDQIMGIDEYKNIEEILTLAGVTVLGSRKMEDYRITQRLMTGAEILDETSWVGKYIPVIPVYGEEINIEGKKHYNSLIHAAKDPQRMHNYWRTTATELVALAPRVPWIVEEGSLDVEGELSKWRTANSKSHPYLQYKKGRQPPQRQMLDSGPAAGALTEAGHAADDMKAIMGMYDASLGQRSNEVSGRAIMARQREGDVSTFHFGDNLSRSIQHCGCILVDLIPKVYTGQRIVRIIDQEGKNKKVQLGAAGLGGSSPAASAPVPPTLTGSGPAGGPGLLSSPGGQPPGMPPMPPGMSPPGMSAGMSPPILPEMMQAAQDADMIDGVFDLSAGYYDVVVDTGPSVTTRREEIALQMTEFTKVQPQLFNAIGDILIRALDWPNADLIADRMEKMRQEGARQSQLEKDVQRLQAENMMLKAGLQIDQQSLKIDQYNAETKRMAALDTSEPDGGSDPIEAYKAQAKGQTDAFNAQTKRMQAESQMALAKAEIPLKRTKTAAEGLKAVVDAHVAARGKPEATNGGSR